MTTQRRNDYESLHPIAYGAFMRLAELLQDDYDKGRTRTLFRVFETYRSPERQEALRLEGSSNARAWQSAHQYGLAADFVPVDDVTGWNWDEDNDWAWLKSRALSLGLDVPIVWDKVHVQHPAFNELKTRIRQMRRGA